MTNPEQPTTGDNSPQPEPSNPTSTTGSVCRVPEGQSDSLTFPNGNTAQICHVEPEVTAATLLDKLGLAEINALIIIAGGADDLEEALYPRLLQLFSRGIAREGKEIRAGFIDGGTDSGVMAMLGKGVADHGYHSPLVGIAPTQKIVYRTRKNAEPPAGQHCLEPHHSHFVLVNTDDWDEAFSITYRLAALLIQQIPVLCVLVNGGETTRHEIVHCVRLGIPIVVLKNSGRLADDIAEWLLKKQNYQNDALVDIAQRYQVSLEVIDEITQAYASGRFKAIEAARKYELDSDLVDEITKIYRDPHLFIPEPELAEIVADGNLHLLPLDCSMVELKRLIYKIYRQLQGDTTLKIAWRQFALYDQNANIAQKYYHRIQTMILVLGVAGTGLAVLQSYVHMHDLLGNSPILGFIESAFRYMLVTIPILSAGLLAAANRFNFGTKWILLRASAESIKREIFRYRTRAEIYSPQSTRQRSREVKLASRLQAIGRQLMQTEVNISALQRYEGPIPPEFATASHDDGLNDLTPEYYLSIRLEDQLNYYVNKARKFEKTLKTLQILIYIMGGVGTLLAALGLELWIALTTALGTAFVAYLEYQQIEKTLIKYNQAATDLFNVRTAWVALTEEEQALQHNIDGLVGNTERILQSEFRDWVQEMQDALQQQQEQQEKEEAGKVELSAVQEITTHKNKDKDQEKYKL